MTIKITIFWDVPPYSLVEAWRLSEGRNDSIFRVEEYAKQTKKLYVLLNIGKILQAYTASYRTRQCII
jgi:hypothetical protein